MKLAPTLQRFVDDPDSRVAGKIQAAAELRALLAVVRAAQRVVRTAKRSGEWTLADAAAARALAALDRASGRGAKGRERT
jgi:hypothetical protein